MTKKIFISILLVSAVVLLACFAITVGVLYSYYTGISESQLKAQTSVISHAVENEGIGYFNDFKENGCRVTWINSDGTVIYDSEAQASSLESHADREEFIEALETGFGKSSRYSSTLTERMLYCAQKLADGTVIRTAYPQSTVFMLFLGMLPPLCIVFIISIALSGLLAYRLSRQIVQPLNAIDLDKPLENDTYDELSPLLKRIELQHRQIDRQLNELSRKREEWNAVTESMNEGIVLLSADNTVLSINKSASLLLDTSADCIGQDMLEICRRIDIQSLICQAAEGKNAEITAELRGREYQINASPIISDGSVKGTALLFFDVTDKLQAEQMRREFTANVSHELKTPLQVISGTSELMINGLVKNEDIPEFAERIHGESLRMITLVDDIIELSRLDEGAAEVPKEKVCLMTAAEAVAERLAVSAQHKDVSVSVAGDKAVINGIPALITELIFNLCDNAIKYTLPGGRADIVIKDENNEAVLTVSDTGVGIPEDAQSRVFERFFRVDKSRSKEIGGTGLGLSIVKHIAEIHNARIYLKSKPGKGTSITVVFPKD
ncbi:MAG: ATP-binding protein [Clostridiales bacterium]|nr:ATP-binding protein [Clostridiales bacterium]